jgi:hypothetical protein
LVEQVLDPSVQRSARADRSGVYVLLERTSTTCAALSAIRFPEPESGSLASVPGAAPCGVFERLDDLVHGSVHLELCTRDEHDQRLFQRRRRFLACFHELILSRAGNPTGVAGTLMGSTQSLGVSTPPTPFVGLIPAGGGKRQVR